MYSSMFTNNILSKPYCSSQDYMYICLSFQNNNFTTEKTMKKKLYFLILIGLLAFCTPAKATLVNIPDANFRAKLQTLFPSCFVGVQMETTCIGITTAIFLNVERSNIANLGITDLSGIEYFSSLIELRCSGNLLTTLPILPSSLQQLDCRTNQLMVLPTLPANLQRLDCQGNQLITLPSLPSSLQDLYCQDNQLITLPPLSSGLQHLNCQGNQLTTLPPLPASLQWLNCNRHLS